MLLEASSWSVCKEFKFEILLCTNSMGTDAPRGYMQGHGDLGLVNTMEPASTGLKNPYSGGKPHYLVTVCEIWREFTIHSQNICTWE